MKKDTLILVKRENNQKLYNQLVKLVGESGNHSSTSGNRISL